MTSEPLPNPIFENCFPSLLDRVLVLTGPTASGKTGLALRVAQTLANHSAAANTDQPAIEIIALDSITVYRGMDIGTAKPTLAQRKRVVHHLLDVVDPNQEYSVAEYLSAAHRCVDEIESRGNRAMFVGGTPMYLKAILRGFDAGPPADEPFRHAVMEDVKRYGIEALRKRLEQVDPLSAARIDPHDTRRMIRALEFARHTGTPISHRQVQFDTHPSPEAGLVFALKTPRDVLHRRIQDRVDEMFAGGLVAEVRALQKKFPELSKTARTAVGYREVLESDLSERENEATGARETSRGEPDDSEQMRSQGNPVAEQVLFHTRRLARRQETWLRSFSEIRSLATHDKDASPRHFDDLVDEMVRVITVHPNWRFPTHCVKTR